MKKTTMILATAMLFGCGNGDEDTSGHQYPPNNSQAQCNNDVKEGTEVCDGNERYCQELCLG